MLVLKKIEKTIHVNVEYYQCDGCGNRTPQVELSMTSSNDLVGWVTIKTGDPEVVDKHYCSACAAARGL